MFIDARHLNNNTIIEGDICIIGAGAAGISIALEWMDTPYKVVLLEGGGFDYDEKVQALYKGTASGQKFPDLTTSRLHYFGGTTGHWAGFCSPFDDLDFEERDWVPNSGWPLKRKDLDPFYERAHKTIQLGPYNYDLKFWQKKLPYMYPFPLNENVIRTKIWQYNQARYGNMYKESIVNAKNIHLYTYANVVDIQTNDNVSQTEQVVVKNYSGKTHTVKAKHFILACGAIQNTRLLLASNSKAKAGLGNDNDLVGRYFMEHIELNVAELNMIKPFATNLYGFEMGVTKASGELGITPEAQKLEKILNGTSSVNLIPETTNDQLRMDRWEQYEGTKAYIKEMTDLWNDADEHAKFGLGRIGKKFDLNIRMEQSPNPNSRVTLGNEKDGLGVPRVHMNWDLTFLDKRSIRTIYYLIGKEMGASGLGRLKLREEFRDENDHSFPEDTHGGNHHIGTTRMDEDPKKGVVDINCKVHGINNLYVAGSACFPTAGGPNPTLTITALSIRLSDFIKGKMK
jgi:choline dehydrogenase-like flavoprotein